MGGKHLILEAPQLRDGLEPSGMASPLPAFFLGAGAGSAAWRLGVLQDSWAGNYSYNPARPHFLEAEPSPLNAPLIRTLCITYCEHLPVSRVVMYSISLLVCFASMYKA